MIHSDLESIYIGLYIIAYFSTLLYKYICILFIANNIIIGYRVWNQIKNAGILTGTLLLPKPFFDFIRNLNRDRIN